MAGLFGVLKVTVQVVEVLEDMAEVLRGSDEGWGM